MTRFDYLIVGGGMTADAAAHGIRQEDAKGSIGIVGAEPHRPYNRPPLTKGLWKGDAPDSIWRKTEETGAELILGRRVVALDPERKRVTDDRGTAYDYGKLLLATGGEPRRLQGRARRASSTSARWTTTGGCAGSPTAGRALRGGRRRVHRIRDRGGAQDAGARRHHDREGGRASARASSRPSSRDGWWATIGRRASRCCSERAPIGSKQRDGQFRFVHRRRGRRR